jgi:hypothetical protein
LATRRNIPFFYWLSRGEEPKIHEEKTGEFMAAGEQSGDLAQRGTEKAEPTKVQGSGIGPKQCPRK